MAERDVLVRPGRENRLLVITIVVSIATLLLLSRFRYPAQDRQPPPLAAPLERLAAHATFDELATTIAQLRAAWRPTLVVLRVTDEQPETLVGRDCRDSRQRYVAAVRTADGPGDRESAGRHTRGWRWSARPVSRPPSSPTIGSARSPSCVCQPRPARPLLDWNQDPWLTAPAYIVAVEGTRGGPALRPLFLGRSDRVAVERWDQPLLMLGGTRRHKPARHSSRSKARFSASPSATTARWGWRRRPSSPSKPSGCGPRAARRRRMLESSSRR